MYFLHKVRTFSVNVRIPNLHSISFSWLSSSIFLRINFSEIVQVPVITIPNFANTKEFFSSENWLRGFLFPSWENNEADVPDVTTEFVSLGWRSSSSNASSSIRNTNQYEPFFISLTLYVPRKVQSESDSMPARAPHLPAPPSLITFQFYLFVVSQN